MQGKAYKKINAFVLTYLNLGVYIFRPDLYEWKLKVDPVNFIQIK